MENTPVESNASEVKRCTCGNILQEGQMFCSACGRAVNAVEDTASTAAIQKFNEDLKKKEQKKKKTVIGVIIGIAAAAAITIAVIFLVPIILLAMGNSAFEAQDYAKAVQYYEQSGKETEDEVIDKYYFAIGMTHFEAGEYEEAADWFDKTDSMKDAKTQTFACGLALIEQQEYDDASECFALLKTDEAADYLAYCEGMIAYQNQDYTLATEKMSGAQDTVEAAKNILPEIYYTWGTSLFRSKDYATASQKFRLSGGYEDANVQIDNCTMMQAEELFADGSLNEARNVYKTLPKGFTYNRICVDDRLEALQAASDFMKICGKWSVSKNYVETRNIYKRNGSWDSWYHDTVLPGQSLTIKCILNSDGTVTLKGSITFYRFTNYSSLSAYCNATPTTKTFTVYNAKSIPSTINVDSYTTLKFSNNKFELSYSVYDYYSSYFYNWYRTTATFGSMTTAY